MNLRKLQRMRNKIINCIIVLYLAALTILYIDVRIRLVKIGKELKTRPTFELMKQRAEYVDISLHDLEYEIHGIRAAAFTALDATNDYQQYDWIEGLTITEIDSILKVDGRDGPYAFSHGKIRR